MKALIKIVKVLLDPDVVLPFLLRCVGAAFISCFVYVLILSVFESM